jgi:hypothetical protein
MSDTTITRFTLDGLRESLQQAGYRVETVTDPVANISFLRSATGGLAFEIRAGNRLADMGEAFLDAALTAVLRVQGDLPLDLVNRWNATRRFGRLQLSPPFLLFCMDLTAAGGVTADHLRAQIEIWDRLVQELVGYLREELRKLAPTNGAGAMPGASTEPTQEAAREVGTGRTIQ